MDLILVTGLPRTGKTTFGEWLAKRHKFVHYDVDVHPDGWPFPELRSLWLRNMPLFCRRLTERHERVVISWTFEPYESRSEERVRILRQHGFKVAWLLATEGLIQKAWQLQNQEVRQNGKGLLRSEEELHKLTAEIMDHAHQRDKTQEAYARSLGAIVIDSIVSSGEWAAPIAYLKPEEILGHALGGE